MTAGWLRGAAIVLAALAVAEPAWTRRRATPPTVHIRLSPPSPSTAAVRDALVAALEGDVTFDDAEEAEASVVIGGDLPADAISDGLPVSMVAVPGAGAPNITVSAIDPPPTLPGWTTRLTAAVRARGLRGRTSEILLEHQGTVLARTEHRWTQDDEVFDPEFSFVPPASGVLDFSIVARSVDRESSIADGRARVRLLVEARSLSVFTYEPRASWAAAFVRRTLEADPMFEVASLVHASRNIQVRSGRPPRRLDSREIELYDLVLIGAPEELSSPDVDALERYARVRGGAVVLLADRRPTGAYTRLIPVKAFEERLTERPQAISTPAGTLHAAEFALPEALPDGVDVVATVSQTAGRDNGASARPVVFGWPAGKGRFVFSGALDAWRWRDRGDGFARFWRAGIAASAAASPRAVTASLTPGMTSPGSAVTLRARVRPTAFDADGAVVHVPAVDARVVAPSGVERQVRLWPTSEPGAFEATLQAADVGDYHVQVTASNGSSGSSVLRVREEASAPVPTDTDLVAVVRATGGVAVDAADLSPLLRYLRTLPVGQDRARTHPMRSTWWAVTFVTLLCGEWALRRRTGRG